MDHPIWQDPGTWIVLGVSALFIVAGFVMHRIFVKVLKQPPPPPPAARTPAPPPSDPQPPH